MASLNNKKIASKLIASISTFFKTFVQYFVFITKFYHFPLIACTIIICKILVIILL